MAQNTVIIGAVSVGPKAGARLRRLQPDAKVVMLDQESLISYACGGIPMFLSGEITVPEALAENNFQTPRDEKYYKNAVGVNLLRNTRALKIDREKKEVLIQNLANGKREILPYDNLVIATGKRPSSVEISGSGLTGVLDVYSLKSAVAVKEHIVRGVEKAVIVGGSFTGVETAQAFADMWDIKTTVIEAENQLLPWRLGPNSAALLKGHMENKGIAICLGQKVLRLEGNGSVQRVVTQEGTVDADLVILATGVEPNADLAREAGIEISPRGAIVVNKRMQTSDPFIYAGGDCVEIPDLVTGKPGYFPWPSLAQRQGRVIGTNIAGGKAEFKGAVGIFATKIFDKSFACAGLNIAAARREGFDAVNIMVSQLERAHFWPLKDFMFLDMVVEKKTGRVLGIQGMGDSEGVMGRVNTVGALLESKPTASDIGNLEIPYSPQLSGAMDIVNTLGNYAENVISGRGATIDAEQFRKILHDKNNSDWVVMDARYSHEAEPYLKKNPGGIWQNISVTEILARKGEVSKDKKLIILCKTGERSYDFQVVIDRMGVENYNLQGGLVPLWRLGIISESGDLEQE